MSKKAKKALNKYGRMKPTTEFHIPVNLDAFDPHDCPTFPNVDYWEIEFSVRHKPNFRIKIRPSEILEAFAIETTYIGIKIVKLWSVHKATKSLTIDEFRQQYMDHFIDPRST